MINGDSDGKESTSLEGKLVNLNIPLALEKQRHVTKQLVTDAFSLFGSIKYVDVHGKGDKHKVVLRFDKSCETQAFLAKSCQGYVEGSRTT